MRNNLSMLKMSRLCGLDSEAKFRHIISFANKDLRHAFRSGDYDVIEMLGIFRATFQPRKAAKHIKYLIKRAIYGDPADKLLFRNLKKQLERYGHYYTFE